jgi:hypothetical protein
MLSFENRHNIVSDAVNVNEETFQNAITNYHFNPERKQADYIIVVTEILGSCLYFFTR